MRESTFMRTNDGFGPAGRTVFAKFGFFPRFRVIFRCVDHHRVPAQQLLLHDVDQMTMHLRENFNNIHAFSINSLFQPVLFFHDKYFFLLF